jgi:gluconokinase
MPARIPIVVMGMAGAGKSTFGRALANALGVDFKEGDELHPRANVEKMSAGVPLSDADRAPWLDAVAAWLSSRRDGSAGGVVSCSALRRRYRDRLRAAGPLRFIFLDLSRELARERLRTRSGHFMPESLIESQWETLETPQSEADVLTLPANLPVATLTRQAEQWLASPRSGTS